MRRLFCFALIFCIVLFFSACSMEILGVPKSVLAETYDLDSEYLDSYKIKHNVDLDTHIDDVELTRVYKGEYGTLTEVTRARYQYDRSTDFWNYIKYSSSTERAQTFNSGAIMNIPFKGNYQTTFYTFETIIIISKIDFTAMNAVIEYKIEVTCSAPHNKETKRHSGTIEVDLYYDNGNSWTPRFKFYADDGRLYQFALNVGPGVQLWDVN